MVFLYGWLGIIGSVCLVFTPKLLSDQRTTDELIPFALFLFGYALATVSFKYESISSKNYLVELLEGEIA